MGTVNVMVHAARASKNAGTVEIVGRSLGVHRAQPSRWNRGATKGPFYERMVEFARALERGGADSIPMLGEMKVMGYLAEILKDKSDKEIIVGFYRQRDEIEPLKEMREQIAARGEDLAQYEEALIASANAEFKLAAFIAAARARKIDLTRYDKYGNLKVRPR